MQVSVDASYKNPDAAVLSAHRNIIEPGRPSVFL